MTINQEVRANLEKQKDEALKAFEALHTQNRLLSDAFSQLKSIDAAAAKDRFVAELKQNCVKFWTNPDEGFDADDSINLLLFEYKDNQQVNPEGLVCGFAAPKLTIKSIPYDLKYGQRYAAVSSINATSGVTLTPFSPLAKWADIGDEGFDALINDEAYMPLEDAFTCNTYLILHDALAEFAETIPFKRLSIDTILHIRIKERKGREYPLYYVYQNEREMASAIEAQGEPTDGDKKVSQPKHILGLILYYFLEVLTQLFKNDKKH